MNMISTYRNDFNRAFRPSDYQALTVEVQKRVSCEVGFRIAETPCFLPEAMLNEMSAIGAELTHRLISDENYLRASFQSIPPKYRVPHCDAHPHFMTADFGLVRRPDGTLVPQLVELQAFPSVFGYQAVLSDAYRSIYHLDPSLHSFLSGHTETSYWQSLGQVVLNGHDPENVVLTDVDPLNQKTFADFHVTQEHLGIQIVDIAELIPRGNKLHYRRADGTLVPIKRIYNRAIVDELIRKQVELQFDCTQAFDVEWAGHPNWYFHISKFSLPYLDHPSVPPAVFLSDWLKGKGRDRLEPGETATPRGVVYENLLLKPLFSFAGKGIEFSPALADLEAIPEEARGEYLLQQRVSFAPVIETPCGPTQAEIRILYVWPDGGNLDPLISLVRLGRGKMMGVDHNRNLEWVGSSAAFFP
jgi:hypothetical protein